MDFLILSLPRSGSAWLANFLTYDVSFCYHEPLADGPLFTKPKLTPITGAIDTSAYRTYVEAPRMFALTRKYDDVEASLRRLSPHHSIEDFDLFESKTKNLITFHYENLFTIEYLAVIWKLIVGTPFNRHRAELLVEMNIQRDLDALVRRVGRAHGGA
jgi:hypothetical protein